MVVTLRIFSIIRVGKLLAKGAEENTLSLYQRIPALKYPTTVAQKQQETVKPRVIKTGTGGHAGV